MPTLYEEWFNSSGNPEPKTGQAGLERFLNHMHALGITPATLDEAMRRGFPRFGESLATQKIDEIQRMLDELRGLV